MNITFLEEEKDEIRELIKLDNYNFISNKNLDELECDILFVINRNLLNNFIKNLENDYNLFETLEINFIIIEDINILNFIKDNYKVITDIKFDECYKNRKLYRFFRIKDKKFYAIIKNFYNFYYIEDINGRFTALNGKKVSKCFDYNNDNPNNFEKDISKFLRYSVLKSKRNKIFLGRDYRICYFDIETNASVDALNTPGEILSVVCQDSLTKEIKSWIINSDNGDLLIQEKQMLKEFFIYLQQFDVLTGWNTMKFDIPYVINRGFKLGIDPSFMTLTDSPVSCKNKTDDRINPWFIKIIGLNLYDMMSASVRALAYLPEKLKDNKLDTVAEAILGEHKLKTDTPAILFKNKRIKELLDYNIQDVLLLMKLDDKIGISDLLISTLEFVPGLNLENSNYNSKIIDYYLLYKFDIIFPTINRSNITDVEGAVVFEPISGIHNNVAVFDISGMYPNLIITFNISPDTIIDNPERDCITIKTNKLGNIYFKTDKEGILVKLIKDFQILRNKYKNLKKEHINDPEYKLWELKEFATKKILSSVYGVFGFSGFRLFDNRIANSITSSGRQLLYYMRDFAEKNDNIVVSGDTDSIFIKNKNNSSDEYFVVLVDNMNKSLKQFVSKFTTNKKYVDNHSLMIEYETLFNKVIIAPAKKKYIGNAVRTKGKILDKPVLFGKGNELVKKDVPDFIKNSIRDLVMFILEDDDNSIDNVVKNIKIKISEIKINIFKADFSQLLIYKEINRDFDSYKVKPQTVRAAINSNNFLNTEFSRQNYKGGILHVKNKNGVEVLFLNPDINFNDSNFKIDYEKYFNKYVVEKIRLIFGDEIYNKVNCKDKKLSDYYEEKNNKSSFT